jgi:adenosylmethionine-8-amino-7-oxononanoate aminotransferase
MMPEWAGWDRDHVWHPYTQMKLVPEAVPVRSASGSFLELENGRSVIDAISSWWVTLHGHAHPAVAEAIAQQSRTLEQVIFAGFTHEPAARLAHELVQISPPGLDRVFFSDDGSTAVEVALKLCLQYWKLRGEERSLFVAIEHAYHGDTFGAMSVSARGPFTSAFERHLFSVTHLPFPEPPRDGSEQLSSEEVLFLKELETVIKSGIVAGFIYEPLLLGSGGMLIWRAAVLEKALTIAAHYDIPTIADEVLTGFGRTGKMFASQYVAHSPTIMTLSKGLTAGFLPMGVTMASAAMYDAFLSEDRSRTFFHGHSYTGNPVSCAAGLASLGVFHQEPVFERIERISEYHREHGPSLASRHAMNFRQIGTIAAFEPESKGGYLAGDPIGTWRFALDRGVLLRPLGDVLYVLPPYSTSNDDLDRIYEVLSEVFER